MIVFKTYLKILKKNIIVILIYTLLLILFTSLNLNTNDNNLTYEDIKPDILIVNEDKEGLITKHLVKYLESKCNHVNIKNNYDSINDAFFYRDISFIIYIPNNYSNDFFNNLNPEIKIKTTNDYEASFANLYLEKYLNNLNIYYHEYDKEELFIKLDEVLNINLDIKLKTKLDTNSLNKATIYYNFLNYSILATSLYVIVLIIFSFNKVKKRTIISSMKLSKINNLIFISNSLFILTMWLIYVILSFILVGKIMFTTNGLILIINSFIFSIFALVFSILIANIIKNKDSINGITNVISLGTSFLCGAFVPINYLPEIVVKIAHILPSYYYISINEKIKTLQIINLNTLKPIILNFLIMIMFIIIIVIINNYITKKKMS